MKVILVEKAILLHLYGPCVRACWRLSYIWLFAALWTVDHQTSLSKGFPGMNTGVGCQAFLQKIFSTQELNFHLLCLLWTLISYVSCLQVDSLPLMPPGKPIHTLLVKKKNLFCTHRWYFMRYNIDLKDNSKALFSIEYRVSVFQDEKSFGDWLYNNVNVLSTTDLYA